jgi:hypothetical protein
VVGFFISGVEISGAATTLLVKLRQVLCFAITLVLLW